MAAGIAHSSSVKCIVGLVVVPTVWYTNWDVSARVKIQTHTISPPRIWWRCLELLDAEEEADHGEV